jgi:hypothetical protein
MAVKSRPGFQVNVDRTEKGTAGKSLFLDIPSGGSVQVRFTPTSIPTGELFFESSQHFKFTENSEKRVWACLNVHGKGNCPVCQALDNASGIMTDKEFKAFIKEYGASQRWHAQVLPVPKEGEGKPTQTFLLGLSKTTAQKVSKILKIELDNRQPLLSDPDQGQTVVISRNNGTGFSTRYEVMPSGLRVALDTLCADWADKFLDVEKALKLRITDRETLLGSMKETFGPALFDKLGVK